MHENRIRQAASSLGAGLHCIDVAVEHVTNRTVFGKPLASNQAVQFPLAELATDAEMIRALIWKTAWEMDQGVDHLEITDKVAMCNYRGNRFCCDAADQAMQACGGYGYGRKYPFEHIYRHHRRYRITEGTEEIQIRKVAGKLFGFAAGRRRAERTSRARRMVPLTRSDTVGIALAPGVGVGFARDDRWSVATADPVALIAEAATADAPRWVWWGARPRICLLVFRSTDVGMWRPCTASCTARGRPRSVRSGRCSNDTIRTLCRRWDNLTSSTRRSTRAIVISRSGPTVTSAPNGSPARLRKPQIVLRHGRDSRLTLWGCCSCSSTESRTLTEHLQPPDQSRQPICSAPR